MARLLTKAPWPIVVAWLAAVAAALAYLPSLDTGAAPVDDIIPAHSSALAAQARAAQLFGVPAGSDVAVVQRRAGGLTQADLQAHARAAAAASTTGRAPGAAIRGALPIVNQPLPGARWREQRTTAVDMLFVDGALSLQERRDAGHAYARALRLAPGSEVGVTGAAPARLAQFEHIEDVLPWISAATIAVVVLMTALYFRALGAPLVTLGCAGIAYVVGVRAAAWLSEQVGVHVPREIEPLLVVLIVGLATDYCVFFMAEARRRLLGGATREEAAQAATRRIAPLVLTAGALVAACSAALLAGRLDFFRVFGPGMAFCALVVTLVTVTLVPALLAIFGARLFGSRVRDAEGEGDADAPEPSRAARLLAARPAALLLAIAVAGGLAWSAAQARDVRLGIDTVSALPADDAAHRAGADAQRGFAGGILGPTDVILEAPGLARDTTALERLRAAIARRDGVVTAVGPGAGRALADAGAGDPMVSRGGGAARIIVVFGHDATSADGLADLRALRAAVPGLARRAGLPPATRISYAGESALGAETVDAVRDDLVRIAIAIAAVTFVLLALFLRALVAPLLVLAAGTLGFLAALGLTTLILGGEEITYFVPLVAGVLVLALGSDYNVLVAGRVRAESARRRARDAIAVAVPQASRAITVAGATMAATFALLAVVPIRPFRELALLLCLGVLIDALVVRPVLIPSLLALAGRGAWWPSRTGAAQREPVEPGIPPQDIPPPEPATGL